MLSRLLVVVLLLLGAGSGAAAQSTGGPGPQAAEPAVPMVRYEGRPYVELRRLAERLAGQLETTPDHVQARLRVGAAVVIFTRDWARVLVDGAPVVLDAPVRVARETWLVPESVVSQVLPKLQAAAVPSTPAAARPVAVTAASGPPAAAAPAAQPRPAPPVATPVAVPPPPPPPPAVSPPVMDDLRFRSYPSFTRIVVETSRPIHHTVEATGPGEARVRLISLAAGARAAAVGDGFIAETRLERLGPDAVLRVVFEGAPGELKLSTLEDPHRLVLDFIRPVEPRPVDTRHAPAPLRLIVLDAGHGGHDRGATGPGGLTEKELVLDVTRRVARLVEEQLDVRVLLTRDGDYFVPLRDRTSIANRERADIFVSIHANAHPRARPEGVETYFLSSEATDSAARQVAALENAAVQLEDDAGRPDIVRSILWDLAQSEFQDDSSRLAEIVQDSITQSLRIPNRGVKQAGFHVLGGAAMPAILIEIGFVTNPREARRLRDPRYRDRIARAIFNGLAEYRKHWDQRARAVSR